MSSEPGDSRDQEQPGTDGDGSEGSRDALAFSDGVVGTIDFSDWLEGPVFEPLKDPSYFARFFIDGGTIAWPNGADIAPETLHDRARASEAA